MKTANDSKYIRASEKFYDIREFGQLEEEIILAILEGSAVVVDVTKTKGVRSDVYGNLFQSLSRQFDSDEAALEASRRIKFQFRKDSLASRNYHNGYQVIFSAEYS